MNKVQIHILTVVMGGAFLLASCASTRVTSDWSDPSYQSRPSKILVMALTDKTADRRLIEDEFVARFNESGVQTIPGYAVLPPGGPGDKDAVAAKAKQVGADTLLMTRLVDRKTEREYVPGTAWYPPAGYYNWPSYYGRYHPGFYPGPYAGFYGAGPGGYSPGYVTERVYGIREANLYDTTTGKLIWSAVSRTELRGNDQKEIKSYVNQIAKSLEKKDLIPG